VPPALDDFSRTPTAKAVGEAVARAAKEISLHVRREVGRQELKCGVAGERGEEQSSRNRFSKRLLSRELSKSFALCDGLQIFETNR